MYKIILLALLTLIPTFSYGYKVEMGDDDEPIAYGRNTVSNNFELLVKSQGDGATKESAYKLYMPWALPAGASHYATSSLGDSSSSTAGIIFDLELTDDNRTDLELFVAVRNSSDTEYVIKKQLSTSSPFVSLQELCTGDSTDLICTDLDASGSYNLNKTVDFYMYVFYADDDSNFARNSEINPSDSSASNGLFFRAYFSNDVSDLANGGETRVQTQEIGRGDKSLRISYTGLIDGNDINVDRIAAFGSLESAGPTATFYKIFDGASTSDRVEINKLENGNSYCFLLKYINRWGLVSSNDEVLSSNCGTPTEIENLIKEKSCYFVTAGFQGDHYVLEYFRHFRDTVLVNYFLGRAFINIYYSTAPQYAHYIYESPFLSLVVRSISYVIYFVMNYIGFVLSGLTSIFVGLNIWKRTKNDRNEK
ncbi:CFI-box-CTERM domain-containing protein [Bacteriovorax sp. Seq25_V]|uniref:CFI-box-CTERM domain-containing protein n=1 Tax=Bacteriovorax sp. Seq25_V TaxID=1201288 RepID=UPI000389EA70|nr:CFI-box-CTERM domain-containing protein [Bacteriovorax sp. Seq25_V]EQC46166.1 hypothetical protein M900_1817 [Bacteriovorax sp. Seq25_V]